jgi:glycerol-3-phosphate O-acyltransferase
MASSSLVSRALVGGGLRRATERLFRHIEVDEAWREAVQAASRRGPLVYVLRNVSAVDYLALDHLTHRFDLPRVGFAHDLPPLLQPGDASGAELRRTIENGGSAALFLKRPPNRIGPAHRGRRGGAELLETLVELQRAQPDREVMMLPQTFVWTQRPEQRRFSLVDTLFGPAEFPGELRQAAQVLLNFRHCRLRAGEPLSLREFLEQQGGSETDALVQRLTYALLRKVERERRVIVGPARKSPDRIREEVLRSPRLGEVMDELAAHSGESRHALADKAREMLREMQYIPDPETQRGLEMVAERVLGRVFGGIDVDAEGIERLRALSADGSVVLLPSHKSHMDYIVLSYVLRRNGIQIPVIAAGENLAFFPAGPLLRRAGAFFIRRSFRGDRLYTAVVDAYVRRLLREGWMIEFFLEGGRSRTGKLLPPMLGLLNMVVSSALQIEGRRVWFVPVSIGYERFMEEGAFARELSGEPKKREDASQLLKLPGVLVDRWGRLNIQFGEPLELGELCSAMGIEPDDVSPARRRALVKRLAHQVMSDINRVTALTPGAVVALALLGHGRRGVSYADLLAQCRRLTAMLLCLGARATPSLVQDGQGFMRENGIREALKLYVKSGLVDQHVPGETLTAEARKRAQLYTGTDVIFTVPDSRRLRLDLAKNQIMHWLVDRALVAVALERGEAPKTEVGERVRELSRLFKYEFMFRADAPFERIFEEVVAAMSAQGEIVVEGGVVRAGPGHDDLDGRGWIAFYATVLRNFLEGYLVAARALASLSRGALDRKDLITRALRAGERMFLQGEIERSEAVSRPLFENAFEAFVDLGWLVRDKDKLALADRAEGAMQAEAHIAVWLRRRETE